MPAPPHCPLLLASCLLLGACATTHAGAFPTPSPVDQYAKAELLYVHGDAGLGTPEGLAGAGVGLAPTSFLDAELGGGVSLGGHPQVALTVGAHFAASESARMGLSTGLSLGPHAVSERPFFDVEGISYDKTWRYVLWVNDELTIRAPLNAGTAMRFHVGVAVPVHSASHPKCTILWDGDEECAEREPGPTPYIGVGVEHHL